MTATTATTTVISIRLEANSAATSLSDGTDNPNAVLRPGDVIIGAEEMGKLVSSRHLYNPDTGKCDDPTMVMMYFRTSDGSTDRDVFGVPQTFKVLRTNG